MLKVPLVLMALLAAEVPRAAVAASRVAEAECSDSTQASYSLAHVLPLFADTTTEAVEWRGIAGVERVDWIEAEVVTDTALCAAIDQQARGWHSEAPDPSVFGNFTVSALRIGPYYAAVVDYLHENSTGWSKLLILAPDDLRVLHSALV